MVAARSSEENQLGPSRADAWVRRGGGTFSDEPGADEPNDEMDVPGSSTDPGKKTQDEVMDDQPGTVADNGASSRQHAGRGSSGEQKKKNKRGTDAKKDDDA